MREYGHGYSNQHSEDQQFQQQIAAAPTPAPHPTSPPIDPTKPVLIITLSLFLGLGALITWWLDLAFSAAALALFSWAMFWSQTYSPKRARRVRYATAAVMLIGAASFLFASNIFNFH